MVMMQSPNAQSLDIPQPATSPSISGATAPNSPPKATQQNTNNNTIQSIDTPPKHHKFDQPRLERPLATKFDTMLLTRFHQDHHQHAAVLALASAAAAAAAVSNEETKLNNKLSPTRSTTLYKDLTEPSGGDAKFAIERLKQLTDHSISRLSPTDDSSNQSQLQFRRASSTNSPTTTRSSPPSTSPISKLNEPETPLHPSSLPHHPATVFPLAQHPFPTLKYHPQNEPQTSPIGGLHPHHLQHLQHQQHLQQQHLADMERMKLARSISNANAGTKDLSDFGFRIQLGGLHGMNGGGIVGQVGGRRNSCSGRSDSSEELVVDGNEDEDGHLDGDGGNATVG